MTSKTKILPLAGLLAMGLLVPAMGSTQTQVPTAKQFFACYVPSTGTVYLIKQPGLRTECASGHVQFSWIAGGGGAEVAPAEVTPAVVVTDANGWAATGTFGSGAIPVTGPGVRAMWYPHKAAFRVGSVAGGQWDDANVGDYSVALGQNTIASAHHSIAMGIWSTAAGEFAAALGTAANASGHSAIALGQNTQASGPNSTALGKGSIASGGVSTAMGEQTKASGLRSTAMGNFTTASASGSIAIGQQNTAIGANCTAIGTVATCSGIQSTAVGTFVSASGNGSVALGQQTTASGGQSTAMGDNTTASGSSSTAMGGATTASGPGSTAMGTDASTNLHTGSFVYGDRSAFATRTVVQATADNSFVVRATGGFRFRTAPDLSTGCDLLGGALSCSGTIHSAVGGFSFPDNTVQTTAATPGVSGQQRLSSQGTVPANTVNGFVDVTCPAGKVVLGGGIGGVAETTKIVATFPSATNAWRVVVSTGSASDLIAAWAICATA